MATPKTFTKTLIIATPEQDVLQVKDVTGDVLGWIDGTGTGQGNLASGGGGTPGGSNTQIQFNNSGSFGGSANLTWNNTNSELLIGPATARTNALNGIPSEIIQSQAGLNPLEIHTTASTGLDLYAHSSGGASFPTFNFLTSRGTQSSPSATQSGDTLGAFFFGGYDGTSYTQQNHFSYQSSENWTPTAHGTHMSITVTPTGTTTSRLALLIDQNTNVGIGDLVNSTFALFQLQTAPGNSVALGAASAAPTDGNMGNGQIVFYLDQVGNNLKIRVKYNDGTLKTATIALV